MPAVSLTLKLTVSREAGAILETSGAPRSLNVQLTTLKKAMVPEFLEQAARRLSATTGVAKVGLLREERVELFYGTE